MSDRQCDKCGARYDSEDMRCTRVVVTYQRRHSMTFYYCADCSAKPVQGSTSHYRVVDPKERTWRFPAPENVDRFRGR